MSSLVILAASVFEISCGNHGSENPTAATAVRMGKNGSVTQLTFLH